MLTKEQNDLLTLTGPVTPGGDLLRRFWQPVGLSEELPAGGSPVPVKLLSEELVLFRDEQGRPGLLGLHCSHRGADLSYGRLEDGGLRCIYHGWLYDVDGRCLEQPGEPAGSTFHERIKHPAYPCREIGGAVFAYMGPAAAPLFPAYEFLQGGEDFRYATKYFYDSNYLQGNEGNIDPAHLSFLHRFLRQDFSFSRAPRVSTAGNGDIASQNDLYGRDLAPTIEVEETDFGIRIFSVRDAHDGTNYVRISNFIYPNLSAFPGGSGADGYSVNWHVPIDDHTHWKWNFTFNRRAPLDRARLSAQTAAEVGPDYHIRRNKANRYLQDREEMRTRSFLGIGPFFAAHDSLAVEGPGQIQDRTQEHTSSTDKAIVMSRLQLLKGIGQIKNGQDPMHVIRTTEENNLTLLGAVDMIIPTSEDWRTAWKRYFRAGEPALA